MSGRREEEELENAISKKMERKKNPNKRLWQIDSRNLGSKKELSRVRTPKNMKYKKSTNKRVWSNVALAQRTIG